MNYDDLVKVKISFDDGSTKDITFSEALEAGAKAEDLTQNKAKFW